MGPLSATSGSPDVRNDDERTALRETQGRDGLCTPCLGDVPLGNTSCSLELLAKSRALSDRPPALMERLLKLDDSFLPYVAEEFEAQPRRAGKVLRE